MKYKCQNLNKKLGFAWSGVCSVFRNEFSFRTELLCALIVIAAGIFFGLKHGEWMVLIVSTALIFSAEFLNTAVENILDMAYPYEHNGIKTTKDIAAAGVFMANLAAIAVTLILFVPRIITLFA
ncbi:MAG: diacylglycerol kinase [Candidatus Omnitrophica bacterium]|nr:diacylglycerol kinase [Candidatus Omnitrophota bacterium]